MLTLIKNKEGIAILISDIADVQARKVTGDKKRHYIMIKRLILQEDIIIIRVYAPNYRGSNYNEEKTDRTARKYRWIHYQN